MSGNRFCGCAGCAGCALDARQPNGLHGKLFDFRGRAGDKILCPACSPVPATRQAAAPGYERRSAQGSGRNGNMRPRQRLSDRLQITPGTRRDITGDEFTDMRRQAEQLEQDNAELRGRLAVNEPDLYAPGSGHSWFADLARVAKNTGDGDGGPQAARDRLDAHERFEHRRTDRRLRRIQAEHDAEEVLTRTRAEASLYTRWRAASGRLFDEHDELRDLERRSGATRTAGEGGDFSPPAWLIDRFVHSPRAGAPLAALMTQLPLPPGGQSVNVPRFAAGKGAGTGVQTADAASVTGRDPAEGTLKAQIQTIAAVLDASLQLVDQSPVPFDETFGADLREDMLTQLDGQLLLGGGSSGQIDGVIPGGTFSAANHLLLQSTNNAAGQSWATGGSSIAASAHQMTAQLYAKLARARGLPPTHWLVSPDVWAIICGSGDGQDRPLVLPGQGKTLHGLPVIEDANIVSTFGGATAPSITTSAGVVSPTDGDGAYAPLLLGRWEDLIYFVSEPRVQVMPDILSGTLQVRYQVRQYVASMPARIVWGGSDVTYSGTSQSGGVNTGAACAYGVFTQLEANGPLAPGTAGY